MKTSVVIRTYNEEQYLGQLLQGIADQVTSFDHETIIVDSGSTDSTLQIAERHGCKVLHIEKANFSFGRSLNIGCEAARGEYLVFVSGHCIPASRHWLSELVLPLGVDGVAYSYGAQQGGSESRFSECQIFAKYYPGQRQVPQEGFFCNNANAALLKSAWCDFKFDEELTGLEDMHLAKRLVEKGHRIAYVPEAPIYHLHDESWPQIKRRFEREAIALQFIMPEIHVGFSDFLRYFLSAVLLDVGVGIQKKVFREKAKEILLYRLMQFWGVYRGNHFHRKLSKQRKEKYFYPK